jgi:hypothetical protein
MPVVRFCPAGSWTFRDSLNKKACFTSKFFPLRWGVRNVPTFLLVPILDGNAVVMPKRAPVWQNHSHPQCPSPGACRLSLSRWNDGAVAVADFISEGIPH